MKAFKVVSNGQEYDYRLGDKLSLKEVEEFFSKQHKVSELRQETRHITAILDSIYFLKLSTNKGTSITTENDYRWNEAYNNMSRDDKFIVPKNIKSGYFKDLFYVIEEKIEGELLATERNYHLDDSFKDLIPTLIDFTKHIQSLNIENVGRGDAIKITNPQEWFVEKTRSWFEAIPNNIIEDFDLKSLFEIVEQNAHKLETRPRHGDFTPWHIFKTKDNKLALIDGEHTMSHSVENYDIAYLIQRIHTVSKRPDMADLLLKEASERKYDINKLKIVLVARAIGGFLDGYLAKKKTFNRENDFKKLVLAI